MTTNDSAAAAADEAAAIARLVEQLGRHLGDPERYAAASLAASKRLRTLAKRLRGAPPAEPTTTWRRPVRATRSPLW